MEGLPHPRAVGGGWYCQPGLAGHSAHPALRAADISAGAAQLCSAVGSEVGARSLWSSVSPLCTGLWPPQSKHSEEGRVGGWATVWQRLREAAPQLPAHRRFLRLVIQEARAEQEEPPAPGGRRGGGRKPLLPFMLCWALPASRSLRSTGRAEPLPLGAVRGGRGAATPSPAFGEVTAGHGGFLEMLLHFLPSFLPPPHTAAPAFQGWQAGVGSPLPALPSPGPSAREC